jgi:hypothetical protein
MNAVLSERMARAARLREYDKPVDYPQGAILRFYYTLNDGLNIAHLTDAVLIPKIGEAINFPLHAFSPEELVDVMEEIEATL